MPALFYRVETLNRKTGEWDLRGEYTDPRLADQESIRLQLDCYRVRIVGTNESARRPTIISLPTARRARYEKHQTVYQRRILAKTRGGG